jgi:Putative prokaryotic signal transducing protein
MAMIDPEQERQRLHDYYSRQMDGRLEQVAAQAAGLSELAREVLKEELVRRGLNVELLQPPAVEKLTTEKPVDSPPEERMGVKPSPPVEFEKRDLATIRKFRDLPEALLAKGSLDSAGIEAFLVDDNMVRMDWFISNLLGGIKLVVDAENAEVANEILNQAIPENFDVEGVGEFHQPRCPRCQSLDISFEELDKPIAYGSLFVRAPIPIHREGWICHSCRHAWESDEAEGEANAI